MSSLEQRIHELPWFHEMDLGNGLLTPGLTPLDALQTAADVYFKDGLDGRSFLDVGCWDGFNSFEAKRRGASRVLATDQFAWSDKCWGKRAAFDLANEALGLDVEVREIDLDGLSVDSVGTFDVVLFAGVLYHLRNPLLVLEQMATLCDETLILETHLDALESPVPAMVFYPTTELGNDPTNWWGPNPACVIAMLRDVGFATVEFTPHPHPLQAPSRGIFHASR